MIWTIYKPDTITLEFVNASSEDPLKDDSKNNDSNGGDHDDQNKIGKEII